MRDYIVTRNQKDFEKSPIAVISPEEALELLELLEQGSDAKNLISFTCQLDLKTRRGC